jgi:hypothetical protein
MLRYVAGAMQRGYSHLLLNEAVLPVVDCPAFFAAADITMMACLAGIQRNEKQWTRLIESVGLQVVRIWRSPDPGDSEAVIEATLPARDMRSHGKI